MTKKDPIKELAKQLGSFPDNVYSNEFLTQKCMGRDNERERIIKLIKNMPIVTTQFKAMDYPDKGEPLICRNLLIEMIEK